MKVAVDKNNNKDAYPPFCFTCVQHVESVYNAIIASSEYNNELFNGDSLVSMPGLRRRASGCCYLSPFKI